MTIETRRRLYEVLIRYDAAGLAAAHRRDLVEIYDVETGAVLSAQESTPEPISREDLAPLFGEQSAALIEHIDRLTRALESARTLLAASDSGAAG